MSPAQLTARDAMTTKLITMSPDMRLLDAIRRLLKNRISGAPVIEEDGHLCGILSELDCLRVLASGEYTAENLDEMETVGETMSADPETVPPDMNLFSVAHIFLTKGYKRLPVVEDDTLIGVVSRRDVLAAVDQVRKQHVRELGTPVNKPKHQTGPFFSATDRDPGEIAGRIE